MEKIKNAEQLNKLAEKLREKDKSTGKTICICNGTGCLALGAAKVTTVLKEEIKKRKLDATVASLTSTGCHGFCERGPLMVIRPDNIFYQLVKPEDIPEIIEETIINGKIIDRLTYQDPQQKRRL